jgi:dihydroorotate dehydrogenase electron transfer subunit
MSAGQQLVRAGSARGGGPVRTVCEVIAARRVGGYHALAFAAPEVAGQTAPGQFVAVAVGVSGAILRRPFSVYGVDRPRAGAVEIVFDVVGAGTAWLAERRVGDRVDLMGPLGQPFPETSATGTALLVGGGYGAAPVLFLAEVLAARGREVALVLGAASAERLLDVDAALRLSSTTWFTTDDGSLGTRGIVTDVLPDALNAAPVAAVHACGPMPMLRAVAALAAARGVPCWVAVEEHMACGSGVCWTCVLPVRGGDGGLRNLRACTEGPVFDGAAVAWEAIGTPAMGNPPLKPTRPAPGQAGP